jgi:ectoine hydroxylase-related dioxygenase (phytanoyl-CoA dioxygenase family)
MLTDAHYQSLGEHGYCRLSALAEKPLLQSFEQQVARVGSYQCTQLGLASDNEPIAAALMASGENRELLFRQLKQLWVLSELATSAIQKLSQTELWRSMDAPTCYHTLKGDVPNDNAFTLPFHQDYRLTQCYTAWRLWIPLRRVDREAGSMELALGSHRHEFDYVTEGTDYPYIPDEQVIGKYPTKVIEAEAGDAILFNPLLAHRSIPNAGTQMKFVLIVHLQDACTLANISQNDGGRISRLARRTAQ